MKTKRFIKLNDIVYPFDMSDGYDNFPFSMTGTGSKEIYINEKKYHGFIENKRMTDGEVNFKHSRYCSDYDIFEINDDRYDCLKKIKNKEEIIEYKKVETILFGLKYDNIKYFDTGYRFGKEITFDNFCICFDKNELVIFSSEHNGFIAPDFLNLKKENINYIRIISLLKNRLLNYFDLI